MSWQDAVERTVSGLGYDLVDANRSVGGLLRVFIDHPADEGQAAAAGVERFITVDDCEKVTRQLQHVLEVDDIAYERLEVSSPGLDRPLKKAADYARFLGETVELTLKVLFKGRRKYTGQLARGEPVPAAADVGGGRWRLWLAEVPAPGTRPAASRPNAARRLVRQGAASPPSAADEPLRALDFVLDEVRDAHLVPVVDFKGRRDAVPAGPGTGGFPAPMAGAGPNDEVDGGRIQ